MLQVLVTFATAISTAFTLILLCLPKQYGAKAAPTPQNVTTSRRSKNSDVSVQVLVLGDIGRSPRMQYHALSIARHGGLVQLIGYVETPPLPELLALENVTIIPLSPSPKILQTVHRSLFLALGPIKVVHQIWNLWLVLGYQAVASEWLLVQNPPSIPTLFVASIVCFLRHTRLVIDWHNFGYSILALKLGHGHPFVQLSKLYEKMFARFAFSHLTVTTVMASSLQNEYVQTTPVMTLHDRPAKMFRPISPPERASFLGSNPITIPYWKKLENRSMRLVVSSTSWTPDEDFGVLLDALCQYSTSATSSAPQLPELLVIITGKGPQKAEYLQRITKLKEQGELEMATVLTAWLTFDDYASLLGAADLGVSLHTSSSGVDLPMKVVDMFGAGLPVLGFDNYKAWPELVTEGVNGRGFAKASQMAVILQELFEPASNQIDILKEGAIRESRKRWDAEWDPVAGRIFGLVL